MFTNQLESDRLQYILDVYQKFSRVAPLITCDLIIDQTSTDSSCIESSVDYKIRNFQINSIWLQLAIAAKCSQQTRYAYLYYMA